MTAKLNEDDYMKQPLLDKINVMSKTYLGEHIDLKNWFINCIPLILDAMKEEKAMNLDFDCEFNNGNDKECKEEYNKVLNSIAFNLKEANLSSIPSEPLGESETMIEYKAKRLSIGLDEFSKLFKYLSNNLEY